MRKNLVVANWKMYKTSSEAEAFILELNKYNIDQYNCDVVICPPYTSIERIQKNNKSKTLKLGAQDLYWEEEGAYTGKVSAKMLKDLSVSYVIIGHSEQRQYFQESNKSTNRKLKVAFQNNLQAILCVGESLEEREQKKEKYVITKQLKEGLESFDLTEIEKLTIAYEPIWAIGTGKTASPEQTQEIHKFIRETLEKLYQKSSDTIRILYGGSVKAQNAQNLISCLDIDGFLVGSASLKVDSFQDIISTLH